MICTKCSLFRYLTTMRILEEGQSMRAACGRSAADTRALQVNWSLIGWSILLLGSDWPGSDAACCSAGKSSAVRPLHGHQRPHAAGERTRARHREDTGQLCLATSELAIVISLWEIIFAEIPTMLDHRKMILDVDIISSCRLKREFSEWA